MSSHPVGPKSPTAHTPAKLSDEAKNIQDRGLVGSVDGTASFKPLIDTASNKRQLCLVDEGYTGSIKKRKVDARRGGGTEDPASKTLGKTSRVSGPIIARNGSRGPELVIYNHKPGHIHKRTT